MTMTMQRVDDRHKLSLPLFYPHYKPGCLKSRSSKDVQFLEASSRSSRSAQSSRQHSESNPNRSTETSLKSCLRKSSEKHTNNKDNNFKDNDNDAKSGHFKETDSDGKQVNRLKHTDCDVHLYAATTEDNGSRFPTKKWRATKVDTSSDDSKENRETVKMKGCGYTRFRYPLRFHYGSSVQQTRSGVISATPAGLRTSSFYSNLPRRQRSVVPGSLTNEKNHRRGKDERQRREKEQSPGEKAEVENDRNSRAASPERELNGVYHVIHEAQEHDTKAEKKQRSRTATRENRSRTTRNQSDDDDDDDKVPEIKDNDEDDSSRRSSRSSQPDRSEESIKEAGSSSEKEKLRNDDGSSSDDDDDDVDLRRDRKVGKRKNKKKGKKSSGSDKVETEYAADFDDDKSETLSRD